MTADHGLTHVDETGAARMVDVSGKAVSVRSAVATGRVFVSDDVVRALRDSTVPKGDALGVARIAGIQAAKRTPDLVPLCHPIAIHGVVVDLDVHDDHVAIRAEVRTADPGSAPPEGSVAILREPGLPVSGVASSPERLGALLGAAGLKVTCLSATELADPQRLLPGAYHLVVLPYGASFPAAARQAMVAYLHRGGSFISMGGYVFNRLLVPEGGTWAEESAVLARRLAKALEKSLLLDGGFETTTAAPVGGMALDAGWRRGRAVTSRRTRCVQAWRGRFQNLFTSTLNISAER